MKATDPAGPASTGPGGLLYATAGGDGAREPVRVRLDGLDRALLGRQLAALRHHAGMTQKQIAAALEWSAAKIVRIEGGRSGVKRNDLLALLDRYGVTSPAVIHRLVDLARETRAPGWWGTFTGSVGDQTYMTYVGFEAGASQIRGFESTTIPPLLQSEAYARTIINDYVHDAQEVRVLVELCMRRQEELHRRQQGLRRHFILDEAVLRRRVGGRADPTLMPAQLQHLIAVSERDDTTVQVIPFSAGSYGLQGSVTILGFDVEFPPVVYLERGLRASQLLTGDDLPDYCDAFEQALSHALDPDESVAFIAKVAEEYS